MKSLRIRIGRALQIAGGVMIAPFILSVIGLLVLGWDVPGGLEVPQSLLFILLIMPIGGILTAIVGMILAPNEYP